MYIWITDSQRTVRWGQILHIWQMRNLSIRLVDPIQIFPIKLAYYANQGFDWVLVSSVVCIIQIFRICPLMVCNRYNVMKWCEDYNRHQVLLFYRKNFKFFLSSVSKLFLAHSRSPKQCWNVKWSKKDGLILCFCPTKKRKSAVSNFQ